jgi:hypothetical protein
MGFRVSQTSFSDVVGPGAGSWSWENLDLGRLWGELGEHRECFLERLTSSSSCLAVLPKLGFWLGGVGIVSLVTFTFNV